MSSISKSFSHLFYLLSIASLFFNLVAPIPLYASPPAESDLTGWHNASVPKSVPIQLPPKVPQDIRTLQTGNPITTSVSISPDFGRLPLSFVPNAGQTDTAVRFQSRGLGGNIFFTPDEVVLSLPTPTQTQTLQAAALNSPGRFQQNHRPRLSDLSPIPLAVVRLRFEGANPTPEITPAQPLPGVANYFIGNDPTKWRTHLSTYAGIVYQELYPSIDLHYDGADGRLKGNYLVSPGADPSLVRWRYLGAVNTQVDAETGDLLINLPGSSGAGANRILTERAPIAWQEIDGQRVPVTVRYDVAEDGSIGFILGEYDAARLLIIDPTLEYSVIFGGGYSDIAAGIAVDAAGSAYIVGTTQSHDFPVTSGAYNGGFTDLFVAKINAGGTGLEYATFIGGSNYECPSSGLCDANIAVDDTGNAYITSFTHSDDFPTTEGAYDDSLFVDPWSGDGKDAIVVKLNGNGTLNYGTYLGGSEWDEGIDIAVDGAGYAYIVDSTTSPDFPTTSGAFDTIHDNTNGYDQDAFIVKLDPSGNGASDLVYATFLGWSDYECGGTESCAIALDKDDHIYVAGATASTDFFTTPGAFDNSLGGLSDAFVVKLDRAAMDRATCSMQRF